MTYLTDNEDYVLGQWYYVAATYDGTSLNLYVNGELKNSTSDDHSGNITYPTNGWHTIGRYKDDNEDDGFDGALDDVLILSKALSSSEIEDSYSRGVITSTNDIFNNYLLVSPNPFEQSITVGKGLKGNLSIDIFSQTGEVSLLKKVIQAGESIDASSLVNGMYIIKITTEKGIVYTEKVVKQ